MPVVESIVDGVALVDYDNEGFPDVILADGVLIPSLKKDGASFATEPLPT
jgi:hypothetical protein